jgi:hypothetical protein
MSLTTRVGELERLDNWLLTCGSWRLRQIAFAIALAINLPNAVTLFRSAPPAVSFEFPPPGW